MQRLPPLSILISTCLWTQETFGRTACEIVYAWMKFTRRRRCMVTLLLSGTCPLYRTTIMQDWPNAHRLSPILWKASQSRPSLSQEPSKASTVQIMQPFSWKAASLLRKRSFLACLFCLHETLMLGRRTPMHSTGRRSFFNKLFSISARCHIILLLMPNLSRTDGTFIRRTWVLESGN